MAAKRLFDESGFDTDKDQPNQKRMKARPTLSSVVREVVMVNFLKNFCSALEPMLRRVVNEEVDLALRRNTMTLAKSPSLRIQSIEEYPTTLQLMFGKKLSLPIFTGTKIMDTERNPLQILLVEKEGDDCNQIVQKILPHPIKIEIVVLDGDFPSGNGNDVWSSEEFDKNILKERDGRRPLLTGDQLNVTLRDGCVVIGDIEFTDNSSWIRSRKFRIGARVVQGDGHGLRIRQAITESFVVKDHRGELYKKHHPPRLEDEVWRLEKIGKGGAFHSKLSSKGINTVQDFLKLSVVDSSKLKEILGVGMSEKMWKITKKHAKECVMSNKLYISRGPNYTLFLNAICQIVKAEINGQTFPTEALRRTNVAYLENLVREAYANWSTLEVTDGLLDEASMLTQGDLVDQTMVRSYQQHAFLTNGSMEEASIISGSADQCNDWAMSSAFIYNPNERATRCNFSESSPDSDLTPARSFFRDN